MFSDFHNEVCDAQMVKDPAQYMCELTQHKSHNGLQRFAAQCLVPSFISSYVWMSDNL